MTFTACEQDAADLFSTEPVAPVMDAHATVLLTENTTVEQVTFSWKGARNLEGDVLYTLYATMDGQTISLTTTTQLFYSAPKETLRTQLIDGFSIKPNNNFTIGLYVVADNGTLQLQSESITANVFVYGDYVPAVVSLGADAVEGLVLSEEEAKDVEVLTWEAARFEYATKPVYKVEALFNEQRTVLAEGLTELKYTVNSASLNAALIMMGCEKDAANNLQLIVTASLEGEGAPSLESPAVAATITPYTPSYPEALTIVGDFGGLNWGETAATSPILKGDANTGEYHGLVAYYGATWGMKVFYKHPKTGADQWVGGTSEDGVNYTISTAIGDNIAPEEGVYLLYANLAKGTMKVTPASVGLIGVGGDWEKDILFTYNAETGLMELKGLEHTAGDFKVRVNGGWGKPWDENAQYNLGGDVNDLTMDGSNIAPEPAVYDVTMNLASNENFKLNLTKTGDVETSEPTTHIWSIVGVGGNWNQAEPPYEMTASENGTFSVKGVTLTDTDEFKVIMDHAWAGDCGMADGTTVTVGQPITLIAEGEVNIKVGVAGTYDIYWDPATMKLYVMAAGSDDPTLVQYALIGKFNEWNVDTQVVMEAANNGYVVAKNVNITGIDIPSNGFKIKDVTTWDNNWGSGTVLELGVPTAVTAGGGNMGLAAEGAYDVYFNPTDLKIIVVTAGANDPTGTPEATSEQIEVGLIGLGGDWNNDVKMTQQTDGSYLIENVDIKASDIFKVRKVGDWYNEFNWGLAAEGVIAEGTQVELICGADSKNIAVAADGTYNVFFYPTLETGTTKVMKNQPAKIKVEKVQGTTPTPSAELVWDAAVWGPLCEANGSNDKNANYDFGNGLQYIAGGVKMRLGADHIQPRGTGVPAENKGLLQLTVSGPGQLVIDISSNNDTAEKPIAIAVDGTVIQEVTAHFATTVGRKVYTIDCAAAKANSVINVYSTNGAYMLYVMKWIPGEGGSTPAPTPTALATPVVTLDPASVEAGAEKAVAVKWDAIANAGSYDVVFNGGAAVNVATNAHTIDAATVKALTKGSYDVSVVAKPADAAAYTQSEAGKATLTVTEAAAPAPAATLEWGDAVFKGFFETLSGSDKNVEIKQDIDFGNGLKFIVGSGKCKFGSDGGKHRIQYGGAGSFTDQTLALTVSGPGTLELTIRSSNASEERYLGVWVDQVAKHTDPGYLAPLSGVDPQVHTIDCSDAKANSVINFHCLGKGINVYNIKWTPKQ